MLASFVGCALLLTSTPSSAQTLSLDDVLRRAASADPTVAATAARLEAAQADVRQAGVRPLARVGVDAENFVGTGFYQPVGQSETTAWYERTWERASKREARTDAVRSEIGVVAQRGRIRSLDLLEKVETLWVEALAAEAAVDVAEEYLAITGRVQAEVERRVAGALDPLFAAQRARTDRAQARIARDQAVEAARIARARLALYWRGDDGFQLDRSAFAVLAIDAAPGEGKETPDLALLTAQRDAAQARVRAEERKGVADPTLMAGVRHFASTNDVALVVGASIPLGSARANRANVERAEAERTAAEAELAVSRMEQEREVAGLVATRAAMADEIGRIDREVLPGARRAVGQVEDGLRRGGLAFTYLEMANARAVVTQARTRRVDLLRRYHLAGVRLDRLTGRHAPLLSSAENR